MKTRSPFYYIGASVFRGVFYATQITAITLFLMLVSKFVEYLMT